MSKPPQPLSQSLSRKTRGGETVRLESRGQAREVTFGSSFERSSKGHLDKSYAGVSKSFCLGLKTPPFPQDMEATRRNQEAETTGISNHTSPCREPPPKDATGATNTSEDTVFFGLRSHRAPAGPYGRCSTKTSRLSSVLSPARRPQAASWRKWPQVRSRLGRRPHLGSTGR